MAVSVFCKECPKRATCKKICEKVEKTLPKLSDGRLPRGEFSYDPAMLEVMANNRAWELRHGKRRGHKKIDYNGEED